MLGSELFGNSNLRTTVRGVFRAGALCGVFAMVMLTAGCPMTVPCEVAADCDDSNGCTTDTCNADGSCSNVDDCDEDHCIVITNASGDQAAVLGCVECLPATAAEDCNDDDACTTDTCSTEAGTVGQCVNTAADCDDDDACTTDACDAATGDCTNTAVDCDDSDLCTDDSCDAATGCVNTPTAVAAACDDAAFCTGEETCDPATGECVAGAAPCTAEQTCNEVTDACDDAPPCTTDADCADDGDFCNGTESCDTTAGSCVSSGTPCADGQTCDEDNDVCTGGACEVDGDCDDGNFCNGTETCDVDTLVCIAGTNPCTDAQTCDEAADDCVDATGDTFDLTLNIDNFTGTADADMFVANVALSNGVQTPTLGIGDTLDGEGADDSLTATLVGTNGTISATISEIETFNFTDFSTAGSWTITGSTITGLDTINANNSLNTNPLVFTNLAGLVDVGLTNTNSGITLNYTSAATAGATDAMALALSNVQGGTVTVTSANTNGIESLDVSSEGVANTLGTLTQTTGTTLTSMSVSGSQNLTVTNALPSTIATVNGATATGSINVNVSGNTGTLALTGGTGNDTFTVGANYTSADVVNGGTGTDTLGIDSAAAAAATSAQTNSTNLEAITITNGLAGAYTPANFSGAVTTNLSTGFNAGSITAVTGHAITSGTRAADSDSAGAGTVTVAGGGIADTINFTVNDSDQMANTFTGVEVLNLVSNNDLDGTGADGAANTGTTLTVTQSVGGTATVNITGAASLTFTGAVTATTINASTFTGNLTMSATSVGATSITGGTGNDTIFGTAGADTTLSGGAGNDQFFGQAGNDNITTGTGNDIISMVVADVADVITDFTPGSDKFDWNTALSSTDASVTLPTGTGAFQSAAQNTAIAVTTTVFELTGTTVATQSAAALVTALGTTATNADTNANILFIVYTTGGGGAIWNWINADADVEAAELTLVATFTTLTADSLGSGDFQ